MTLRDELVAKGHRMRYDRPLRPQIWKILLGVETVDSAVYNHYIDKGPSSVGEHIKGYVDSFYSDWYDYSEFYSAVPKRTVVQLINALVWWWEETECKNEFGEVFGHALVFLYTMPSEADAFHCLQRFVERCPSYIQWGKTGDDTSGKELLGKCLKHFDSSLHALPTLHLYYANVSIETFSAHIQEPGQVVKLWDLFLSHGLHLNVLSILSEMLLNRDVLMGGTCLDKVLRSHTFTAEPVIHHALELEQQLPQCLLNELKGHLYLVDE